MIEIHHILEVEQHIDGLEAVIFDLDDTLYSEKEYVRSGYRAVAQTFPEIPTMFDELWAAFEKKEPAIDTVLAKHGLISEKDSALQIYRFHQPSIRLYPGVEEMLKRIRRDKKTGIITDGRPEGQQAKLKALGLYDMVDEVIITDELGGVEYRKPNDTAFRLMAERLQVQFEQMCYVGDNVAKDFLAPDSLGIRGVFLRNTDGLYYLNLLF